MVWSGQYKRSTGRDPDWYRKRPVMHRGDEILVGAYNRLSTCRPFANGDLWPIPWDKIHQYGVSRGFAGAMLDFFVDVMMLVDQEYRHYERQQAQEAAAKDRRQAEKKAKEPDRVGGVGARRRR